MLVFLRVRTVVGDALVQGYCAGCCGLPSCQQTVLDERAMTD